MFWFPSDAPERSADATVCSLSLSLSSSSFFFFFVFFADRTQVKMRRAPEVRLIYDKTVEEQEKLDEIFSDMRREREEGRRQREGGEGDPAAAAMAMDPNDKEFLDNQDFYLDDSAFTE